MSMINGAIFDCDGTLLDTMPLWRQAAAKYLSGLNIEVDQSLGRKFFEMTLQESAIAIREEFNLNHSVQDITAGIYDVMAEEYRENVGFKPGTRRFIKAFAQRNIPITVVSSGTESLIRPALERLGVSEHFRAILASAETGVPKRQPDMFLMAAQIMGCAPQETWVFEDALYAIKVAKNSGFHTVAILDQASADQRDELEDTAEEFWEKYPDDLPNSWLE